MSGGKADEEAGTEISSPPGISDVQSSSSPGRFPIPREIPELPLGCKVILGDAWAIGTAPILKILS